MIKILKSKNFINSVIVSLIIASFITFFYDKNNTERFYKKLEISNLLSQEQLAIQKLKMAIAYDPFIFKLDIFSKNLNYLAYDQNSDCSKINRINNVVPVVIKVRKNSIVLEIVGENKNIFDSCINFILNEVKKENSKIVDYYNELVVQFIRSDNKKRYKNIDDFLLTYKNFKNEAEKKLDYPNLQEKTGISQFMLAELYKIYVEANIMADDLYFPQLAKVSVEQLEYWKVYISDQRIEKKINLYIIFCVSFVLVFSILFQFLNRNSNKNLIIIFLKKFFNLR